MRNFSLFVAILSFASRIGAYSLLPIRLQRRLLVSNVESDDEPKLQFKEDNDKPFVSVRNIVDNATSKPKPPPQKSSKVSATFGSLSIDDLNSRMMKKQDSEAKPLPVRTEDLNGIQPYTPLVFSVVAGGMSFAAWQASSYLAAHFAVQFLTSDIYPVRRVVIVARNVLVGLTTLASGFSGVVCLGLIGLGIAVTIGVMKGELDPNKSRNVEEPIDENTK